MTDVLDLEPRLMTNEGTCRASQCVCLSYPQKIQAWPYMGAVCPMWHRIDEAADIEVRRPLLQRILGLVR